ncbi:phosphatase 2C-like domain-containing protein [Cantharellus anzutake]|uniref:phosphatase 2C-like domain-containing protein n=1 Tax=Cantharellus anzutake TaxID=1750568 RepID=UPI001908E88B|nr:phosphatase 2C-like domain-containing protein [Cantharellus anzutake]KAF8313158.1 phosphatase 2C-like domain-containing protein [Cantharellus anzutake]
MQRLGSPLRRAAFLTLPVATAGIAWYNYPSIRDFMSGSKTFEVHLKERGADGKPVLKMHSLPRLSEAEVDAKLREHAYGQTVRRYGGLTWKYQTAFLAANDGIEDAHSQALVEQDISSKAPPGDLLFFAVMDGHAGPHTSRLLSRTLIPSVAFELASLISSPLPAASPHSKLVLNYFKRFVPYLSSPQKNQIHGVDPSNVSEAIKNAFVKLDHQIINAPIGHLKRLQSQKSDVAPHEDLMSTPLMLPAMSGSCALFALLDTARRDMYVACTGDSRAVAGYWDEPADGSPGYWRAEVLTEDQTGRNPNELKRMQSEHPADEADTVIQRGRVLGGLEPTRAFGDARYKWARDIQESLVQNLLPPNTPFRKAPKDLKTPPYVTSEPVITHRKLDFISDPSSTSVSTTPAKPKSTLRFVVLATDGLWDELSSSEVVSLVGGHLAGLKGSVPKTALIETVRDTEGAMGVEGKSASVSEKKQRQRETGEWAFVDDHVGTHVIRNAFGGADRDRLDKKISIPLGMARNFRDDVTVTVIWYEKSNPQAEIVKAKL